MGRDGYQTLDGDHFVTYANVKSLCSTPETNIILYVNHISIKKKHMWQIHIYKERERERACHLEF